VFHHKRGLRSLLKDNNLLTKIEKNWKTANLSDSRKAMLTFAVKLTKKPKRINIKDINKLRLAEFSDRDILDIVEVTAYYAYANRIADGLGITKEDWITDK
tara:strand:- start:1944 stop:2246 length:303 start_codon:yes stop_codon:yes gene_type:complete